jgi:twinkle protein
MTEDKEESILAQLPRQDAVTAQLSLLKGEPAALAARGIAEKTCRIYDYIATRYLMEPAQVACYRDANGLISAQHIRRQGKQFAWLGRVKGQKIQLWGQHLGSGGRLIVTEGEIDAMTVYQVLAEFTPFGKESVTVVSIPDGAQSAKRSISEQLLWIGKFDSVTLFFDMDEPGRLAALECAEVIGGKAATVQSFPYKDANEALLADDVKAIRDALLAAKRHRPEAIVHAPDMLANLLSPNRARGIQFPWIGWNQYTLGAKPGELWLVAGGTNIGKSAVTRSLALDFARRGIRTAYVALEESCETTLERMLSEELGLNPAFHCDTPEQRAMRDPGLIREALSNFAPNLFLLDRHIDESFDSFVSSVKHYVVGEECKVIFLDHFSILADGIDLKSDQRRAIDKCIKEFKSLCVHYNFTMFVVCHLSRDKEKVSAEEGGEPQLYQLRGSQSLAQIPDYVVMLQRNPKAKDPIEANMTTCWLKKNRPTGRQGAMSVLHYLGSCRFYEVLSPSRQ